jgi:hypothetical protein
MVGPGPQPPLGFFAFLGHGFTLLARNQGLFLPLLALTSSLTVTLLLGNVLIVQPLATVGRADPSSMAYRDLVRALQADVKRLLLVGGARLLAGSTIKVATVLVVVAAFSDHRRPVAAAGAQGNARWGALVLTLAFGYALQLACLGVTLAAALLAVVLLDCSLLLLLFFDALLVLLACLSLAYLSVVCAMAVVVSAAEPWRHGAAAVSRAWRLLRGHGAQAAAYVVATLTLDVAVSPIYTLALRWWPLAKPVGAVAGVAYVLLLGALELFSIAALTALYFECRDTVEEEEEIMADHQY